MSRHVRHTWPSVRPVWIEGVRNFLLSIGRILCVYAVIGSVAPHWLSAQQQRFRQYGTAEGLTNLNVRCLLQDRTGYLWVGSDNGLFRFDGSEFREYGHQHGLPNTEINALAESPATGQLWVATPGGLVHFDGGKFVGLRQAGPAASASLRQIAFDSSGEMFLLASTGILKGVADRAGDYRFHFLATGDVYGMLVQDDALYFGYGSDLERVRGDRIEAIGAKSGLPPDAWGAIAKDSFGNLWFRSPTKLFELPVGHSRVVNRSTGIPHTIEPQLSVDQHGHLYVSTLAGAVVYSSDGNEYLDFQHGLPAETVAPILVDRDDTLWLGLTGGGLVRRLGRGEWASWKREDGLLHNSVWAIHRDDDGKVWVGTSGGLVLLTPKGTVQRSWTTQKGLPADRVLAIEQAPSGDVFVGTDPQGVSQFAASGRLLRTYGEKEGLQRRVTAIAIDREERLWVLGVAGVFRSQPVSHSGEVLHFSRLNPPKPTGTSFRDIVVTKTGVVWIAGSEGLRRYVKGQWRTFTTADGLAANDLDVVAERNGDLWVAYRDALGMTHFEVHGDTLWGAAVTIKDGLSSDDVYALAFDRAGHLWATSDKGVDLLADGRWRHFSSENGLVWDDTNSRALEVDKDGNVWIGTSGGMSRYSHPAYAVAVRAPTPVLTAIHNGNRYWQPNETPLLRYADRNLAFKFAALEVMAERTHFRYRMLGSENRWIETVDRTVQYAALPPGRFCFEVSARGEDGRWSPALARFSFEIQAPWWERWYVVVGGLALIALLACAVWKLRLRALILQRERLQRVVDLQTAELREQHQQLESFAYLDQLTSLPNRRMFTRELRARMETAERNRGSFALLLVDLDRFKEVNDNYGHDAGDAVLAVAGARLAAAVRPEDSVARLGGDEFAVLFGDGTDLGSMEAVCVRILESCAAPVAFQDDRLMIGCSIGVAVYPMDGNTEEALCKSADLALYTVKRSTRNGFCFSSELQTSA